MKWLPVDIYQYLEDITSMSEDDSCMELLFYQSEAVTDLVISNNLCNDYTASMIDFTQYTNLESLEIGDSNFQHVSEFVIDGFDELKSLKIGENSFTKNKNSYGNDSSRSFSVLNCVELESIEIGRYSFSDYGGGFELKNLPKLSTIKIGEIGTASNFYYSSFEIKGIIDMILLMNRSSTFEFHWIRWLCIPIFLINSDIKYLNDLNEYLIDLPNLITINLGKYALYGSSASSCSLKVESNIDINELIIRSS